MSDPGEAAPGRDSRIWPVLLAAGATAAAVLIFLALLGPSDGSSPSADDSPPGISSGSPSPARTTGTPTPAPTPTATPTPTLTPAQAPSPSPAPSQAPVAKARAVAEPAPLRRLSVVVFNQTTRRHLAAQVGEKIERGGWTVVGVDNWIGSVPQTTVYYPDGYRRDAQVLASYLGVDRTRSAVSPMRDDRLTVILMTDYPG